MLVSGPLPRGEALLGSGYSPIPLYRTPGYPAVISLLQFLAPTNWLFLLLGLQILAQAVLAAYAYRVGLVLCLKPPLAFLAALMPAVGSVAVFQSAVMTDALFGALFSARRACDCGSRKYNTARCEVSTLAVAPSMMPTLNDAPASMR